MVRHHYDKNARPAPRSFYEKEFGLLHVHRGRARVRCFIHKPDKHPSLDLNLETGGYRCWSCGVRGGDVVDFTMAKYAMDFKSACQLLGAWRQGDDAVITAAFEERKIAAQHQAEIQERSRRHRLELHEEIHSLVHIQAEASARLDALYAGAAEVYAGETDHCWAVLATAFDDLQTTEEQYMRLAGLERGA